LFRKSSHEKCKYYIDIKVHAGSRLQRKKILTLTVVFFATLPVSLIVNVLFPWGSLIARVLISLGVYWVTAAEIAWSLSAIINSLFFAFLAWLFLKLKKNSKVQTDVEG